jgi:cytidylate kinase
VRRRLVITIDGPSGAGKSTAAKALALALDYGYMDTGAMYRAVAYAYSRERQKPDLEPFLQRLALRFIFSKATQVFLNGEDISQKIRTPEISLLASALSQDPHVRRYLTAMQRELGQEGGVVLEGRDTGSVVFPDAEVKFYLDAEVRERARRRYRELCPELSPGLAGQAAGDDLERVKEEIEKRDRDDSEREIAPLVQPPRAHYVDTTRLDIEDVVRILKQYVEQVSR